MYTYNSYPCEGAVGELWVLGQLEQNSKTFAQQNMTTQKQNRNML